MPSYGFRLFDATLRRGMRQTVTPFHMAGASTDEQRHYREALIDLLTDLKGRLLVGQPRVTSPEGAVEEVNEDAPLLDRLRGQTAFRLEDFTVTDNVVHGIIRRGTYGSHDKAMGSDDESEDLSLIGYAPSTAFRFLFNLPDEGSHAMLAVEDISRACPADLLVKYLGQRSRELSETALVSAEATRAPSWWRLVARQVTDPDHLERLLRQGTFGEVKLTKRYFGADRSRRGRVGFAVTAPRVRDGMTGRLKDTVLGWRRDVGSDEPPISDAEGARQLAALIADDLADIPFDEGYIKLAESGNKRLSPSRLVELFTYEQNPSDCRSSGLAFYRSIRAVAARLEVLQEADELGLEWPEHVDLGEGP